MEIRVLGCSGGIGGERRTTSLMVNGNCLIDAGSGVNDLSLEEMVAIRHIFLTHSHLDHVHAIPLLIDSIFDRISTPIAVHGLPDTLSALRDHVFNWVIWPDFTALPSADEPVLTLHEMYPGEVLMVDGCRFEMIPVNHTVPAVGYLVQEEKASFAFSGDTTSNDTFWERLNREPSLDLLFVETAFPSRSRKLCEAAKHYCPETLALDLAKLKHQPKTYLSHAKPGDEPLIASECQSLIDDRTLQILSGGELFTL